jgi:hypothetical protein
VLTQTIGHWLLFGSVLFFSNLPFLVRNINGWVRLCGLIIGYFIVGLIGFIIEGNLSQVNSQGWEFYVLTACLFLVFAFPGFIYRFLWRSPKI